MIELTHPLTQIQLKNAQARPSAVYIFAGQAGTGRSTMALEFGRSLTESSDSQNQYIQHLVPERGGINIADVRSILDSLTLKPLQQDQYRTVIIEAADQMNPEAANALLKILEEPPDQTVFVLIASSLQAVLPTIRSRAQIIRFLPVSDEVIRSATSELSEADQAFVSEVAAGQISQAQNLAEDEVALEKAKELALVAREFLTGSINQAFLIAKNISSRAEAQILLSQLYLQARTMDDASRLLELCFAAEQQLSSNLSPRLVFENFTLERQV